MKTYREYFNEMVEIISSRKPSLTELNGILNLLLQKIVNALINKTHSGFLWEIAEFNYELIRFNNRKSYYSGRNWMRSIWGISFQQNLAYLVNAVKNILLIFGKNIAEEDLKIIFKWMINQDKPNVELSDLIEMAYRCEKDVFFISLFGSAFSAAYQEVFDEILEEQQGKGQGINL